MKFNRSYFPHERFAFGVSTGIDSLVCAHFLYERGFNPFLIHFNQHYVKCDEEAEIKFKSFCHDFGYDNAVISNNIQVDGNGVEDTARKLRYSAILNLCKSLDIKYFGTAHHLSDACESYLVKCLQGKPDYCPIPPFTNYKEYNVNVFRPFLLTRKSDILKYCEENSLTKYVVEDTLNHDTKLQRAWVRHELIPKIEDRYKGLEKVTEKIVKKFVNSPKFNPLVG